MLAAIFWISSGLIAFTHVGYAAVLWALRAVGVGRTGESAGSEPGSSRPPGALPDHGSEPALPHVSLIIAAYDEQEVIADKVANALALDYPRDRLEILIASDGSADATVERATAAGADRVLDLPRGGKSLTQNAAVQQASGEILAFSDANSYWEPSALKQLVAAFADPDVGYACGQVSFLNSEGDNQEGVYWRYEMAVRQLESDLGGVTAGNGAIYAVSAADYIPLGPAGSHDLSYPFLLAKKSRRSVYVPSARATEQMVPSLSGEWSRKRRMMIGIWDIVVGEGMIRPQGYGALYGFEIYSHRIARYLTPFLHLLAFAANLALLGEGWVYKLTLAIQLLVLAAAALAPVLPFGPLRIARYYVSMTASIAAGLWDRLLRGAVAGTWEKAEGTRGSAS